MSEFKNRNIRVFIETNEGKVKSVGLGLLTPDRMLADKAGEELVVIILDRDNEEAVAQVRQYGVDRIINVGGPEYGKYSFDAYAYTMAELVQTYRPPAVLIGATNNDRDFEPHPSYRLRTGLTADYTSLDYDAESDNVA